MKQEKRPVIAGATRPMLPGTAVSALIGYTETPHQVLVVDRPGFEPETPCLQSRRSTWLSYAALKVEAADPRGHYYYQAIASHNAPPGFAWFPLRCARFRSPGLDREIRPSRFVSKDRTPRKLCQERKGGFVNRHSVALALAAILATGGAEAQQGGIAGISPEAFGAKTWREGGMDAAALPLTGNRLWDVRLASDGVLYYWDGADWVAIAGGITNGSGLPPTAANVSVADAGGWFTGTDVEAALQEIGADPRWTDARSPLAHGHSAGDVTAGILSPERLGSGTPAAGSYLDGSGAWAVFPEGGGVTDHGALTGLADDDHPQYPLRTGSAGGQSIAGGVGAGEALLLRSTSHSTPGQIQIGGSTYSAGAYWVGLYVDPSAATMAGLQIRQAGGTGYTDLISRGVLTRSGSNTGVWISDGGNVTVQTDGRYGWSTDPSATSGSVNTTIRKGAAGVIKMGDALQLTPRAAPPVSCGSTATEGSLYTDDSHALCYCNGTTWTNLTPGDGGTCS